MANKSKELFQQPQSATYRDTGGHSVSQRNPSGYRNLEPSSPAPMPSLFKEHLQRAFLTWLSSSLATRATPIALLPSATPHTHLLYFFWNVNAVSFLRVLYLGQQLNQSEHNGSQNDIVRSQFQHIHTCTFSPRGPNPCHWGNQVRDVNGWVSHINKCLLCPYELHRGCKMHPHFKK